MRNIQARSPALSQASLSRALTCLPRQRLQRAGAFSTSAAPTSSAMDQVSLVDRVRGALWGIFIADALSMPVHWYYNPNDIVKDFGEIKGFVAPKARHPSSIMSVSNTGGHGRGGQGGRIVGDVINHGKHEFWGKSNVHYHQGMQAGENTLNALCARLVLRSVAAGGGYDAPRFLADYVTFMTTPGSHNDTYAESFHRDFFKNWAAGVPPEKCAKGTEGHNTAQIGGFVMLPPVIYSAMAQGQQAARKAALTHLALTHDSSKLAAVAEQYTDLMLAVASGRDFKATLQLAASRIGLDLEQVQRRGYPDVNVVHSTFGSACYIEDSYPSMLYLAYRHGSFEASVLSNTNVGGENCHRGAALGALVGAAYGVNGIPQHLREGLHDSAAIAKEIDDYVTAVFPDGGASVRTEL